MVEMTIQNEHDPYKMHACMSSGDGGGGGGALFATQYTN